MRSLLIFVVILALLLAACGGTTEPTAVATDVEMTLSVEPDPPTTGEATLIVQLTEADGTPVEGATVEVYGDMDHEGMQPVTGEADSDVDGEYRVPFVWTMGGGWILTVTATLPDDRGVTTETFELFVGAVSRDSIINQTPGAEETGAPGDEDESP